MKGFKQLALVTAIAAAPVSGFAMEALDDATLSGVTGQDGIIIELGNDIAADIIIHDKDGFTGATNAGAIVLRGFSQTLPNGSSITLAIDAGHDGVNGAVLNVGVTLPTGIVLDLGEVDVAESNRPGGWGIVGGSNVTIMTLGQLTMGATTLNIQLGNEYQGSMIAMATTITGGITLSNFSVIDAGGAITGGELFIESLQLVDNGGANLTIDQDIDIDADGLVINVNTMGSANGADLRLANVRLGSLANGGVLGDVEIQRLDLTGTIRIRGN